MKQKTSKLNSETLLRQAAADIAVPSFERFQQMMVTKPESVRYTQQRSQVRPRFRPFRSWAASILISAALVALAVIVVLPSSDDSLSEGNELLIDEGNQELYMLSQEDAYADMVINNYVNQFLKIGEPDYQ